jgi:uncharacterized protein
MERIQNAAPPERCRSSGLRRFLARLNIFIIMTNFFTTNKYAGWASLAAGLAGLAGLIYIRRIEPAWLEISQLELALPRLAPEFDGFRLVQISDIHMDGWMNRNRLAEVVSLVNELQPDLVAITGDFVTHRPKKYSRDLIDNLVKLKATYGAAAVMGNHDHWSNPAVVRQVIKDSGLIDLNNRVHSLKRGEASLHMAGLDCIMEGQDRLDLVLDQMPEDGAAVLLAHEPDVADRSAASGRFDLQISGHSHGGQVNIPLVGPPYLPEMAEKYPLGLYQIDGMLLYTNRGLGMVHMPFRFNSRPEMTVYTLRSGQQKEEEEPKVESEESKGARI